MYDLHAHILPNVDDGAKTIKDFVGMAKASVKQGTKVMVATPHRRDITENFSIPYLKSHFDSMVDELSKHRIDLKLLLGMENHLDLDLPNDLQTGISLTLNNSTYALVELPFFGFPNYVEEVLFKIQVQGITPVLAHPERLELFQMDPEVLFRLVERGMLTQVTAGSVTGHFGSKVKRLTESLLRRGLVHVLASDTHFPTGPRSPELASGMLAAANIVGQDKARYMVVDTPRTIINGGSIKTDSPLPRDPARRWWSLRRN